MIPSYWCVRMKRTCTGPFHLPLNLSGPTLSIRLKKMRSISIYSWFSWVQHMLNFESGTIDISDNKRGILINWKRWLRFQDSPIIMSNTRSDWWYECTTPKTKFLKRKHQKMQQKEQEQTKPLLSGHKRTKILPGDKKFHTV